jgi:hypothetical protein
LLPRRPGTLLFLRKDAKRSGAESVAQAEKRGSIAVQNWEPFTTGTLELEAR